MRILYLHQNFNIPERGCGTRSFEFGWRLVRNGHAVTIITANYNMGISMAKNEPYRKMNIEGMEVVVLNCPPDHAAEKSIPAPPGHIGHTGNGWPVPGYDRRTVSAASGLPQPDIILASTPPLNLARTAAKLGRRFRVPVVLDVDELWPEAPIQKETLRGPVSIALARRLERKAYRSASRIIVHSPGMISGALRQGAQVEKIEYIPNGADVDKITPGPADEQFLKEHGLEAGFAAVYAGNVHANTGLEMLTAAAATLSKADNINWVITGEGDNLNEIRRHVADAGLQERVRFPGNLSEQEVARLYRSAGCMLVLYRNLPAQLTGAPDALFDGLAAGKPVITNLSGWTADLLHDNNAGVAVPPDNFRELARAVESLSKRPELARMMGSNARTLAEEKFDREMLFQELENLLISARVSN